MPWPTTSRHERGYGKEWTKLRERVLRRDNRLCQPCLHKGIVHPGNEVDHIKPKHLGGTDDEGNLQTICTKAHREKTMRENGATPKREIAEDGWPVED